MLGRSNNVTLASASTTLGNHLHRLHHHHKSGGYGVNGATSSGKPCEFTKNTGKNHHHNNNFTTKRSPRHNVAIATQVISPSAIGQSSSFSRRRLVSNFAGNDDDEEDDDSLVGGRKRFCSWGKFGCCGTAIAASIVVMTIIILAVGYMQSEKERVFSKPARFASSGNTHSSSSSSSSSSPLPDDASNFLESALEPSVHNSSSVESPTSRPPPNNDSNELHDEQYDNNEHSHYEESMQFHKPTSLFTTTTTDRTETEDDFLNEISDFTQTHHNNNNNNGLHQQETFGSEEFGLDFTKHSPPAEVKVLPPKDFNYNSGSGRKDDIVVGVDDGSSFAIPIYSSETTKNETGARIASDILNGFTFATTTPSYAAVDGSKAVKATTTATNPYNSLTTPTPSITKNPLLSQQITNVNKISDYSIPTDFNFSFEPTPIVHLNTKTESTNQNDATSILDIPVVAKLQTDLFDDDEDDVEVIATSNYGNQNKKPVSLAPRNNHHQNQNGKNGYGGSHYNDNSNRQHSPPAPKIKIQDRTYTPRPGSITIVPDRPRPYQQNQYSQNKNNNNNHNQHHSNSNSQSPPSQRPQQFPFKTTSTTSSFSKLYEFHNEASDANNNHNHGNHPTGNTKVEYINIGQSQNQSPSPAAPNVQQVQHQIQNFTPNDFSQHNQNYDFSAMAATTPYPSLALSQPNPYIVDYPSNPLTTNVDLSKYNLQEFDGSKYNLNLNNGNTNANNGILPALAGNGVSNNNFGIATNAHLGAISNFDNFDFSKFLTKQEEPTASNNYGGATTPVSDTEAQLTKRTFYMQNFDSTTSPTYGSNTPQDSSNPYAYLFGAASQQHGLANVLGSTSSTGASLSLYQNNFEPANTNYYSSNGNDDRLPSGSIPLDLASSYIPVTHNFGSVQNSGTNNYNYGQFATPTNNNAYNPYESASSQSGINYNDPTSALSNYYPGISGNTGTKNSAPPNYNTITQGIHLLSLLSGNIPHHLLSNQDQQSSSSNGNSQYQQAGQQYLPLLQSRSLESSDLYPTKTLASSLPDQLGSFSQNILTKFHELKKTLPKLSVASSDPSKVTKSDDKKPAQIPSAQPMDILGIRGLLSKYNSDTKNGRDDKSDLLSILQPESSSLVKKDLSEKNNHDLDSSASSNVVDNQTRGEPNPNPSHKAELQTAAAVDSIATPKPEDASSKKKIEKGLKSGFYT